MSRATHPPAPIPGRPAGPPPGSEGIEWVSASEIGSAAYCGRMLWLTKVRHVKPDAAGQQRLAQGTVNHHRHGRTYDVQLKVRRAFYGVLVATMLVAFLLWLYLRVTGGR